MLIAKDTKQSIRKYLKNETHPGLILLGDKGIGKRLMADEIARHLLDTDNLNICPDYMVVESDNGAILLEHLEKIKQRSLYCAVAAPYKIFIIDDADTMNGYSQNSLLKILEDGYATNIFVFVAHKPLLDTIHSRCEVIRVNNPSVEEIQNYFSNENIPLDEMVMNIAHNRIGLYHSIITDEKFINDSKRIVEKLLSMQKKRDLLEAFGLIKENASDNFYECHSIQKVLLFIEFLKGFFMDVLYDYSGIDVRMDYAAVKRLYDLYNCCNIIKVIEEHLYRMKQKGKYTKNDFFDLIRFMVQ